jgi:hypothetical protein
MDGDELPRPAATPSESGNCRTLVLIDSLMWQQPDSAFALLQEFAVSPEADSLVTLWYREKVITPMTEEGINPGLMIYQPSK